MNTYSLRVFALLLGLLVSVKQIHGYVYGYTRLYRADTQTTLDIVYDLHVPAHNLSHDSMLLDPCSHIKEGLYSTERALVAALEDLNRNNSDDASVIWEYAGQNFLPSEVHLLTYPNRLVVHRLRNLQFIAADTWRLNYPASILSILRGGTLESRIDRQAIVTHSGSEMWEKYQLYLRDTQRRLNEAYRVHADKIARSRHNDAVYKQLFFARFPYAEIADLEMLSHILSSPNHRIVVFAGGAHSESIANFLLLSGRFELIHSIIDPYRGEIDYQQLALISQNHADERFQSSPRPSIRVRKKEKNLVTKEKISLFKESKQEVSLFTEDERTALRCASALVVGAVVLSALFEQNNTPGSSLAHIAKEKFRNLLQYGSVPALAGYMWLKSMRPTGPSV